MNRIGKRIISVTASLAIVLSSVGLSAWAASPTQLAVVSSYADTFHFEIKMEDDITGSTINNISKVSLVNASTGARVSLSASDVEILGDTFRFTKTLAADTPYNLAVSKGFGTESTVVKNGYAVQFTVDTLWSQDFSDSSVQIVGNLIRAYDTSDNNKIKIKNGRLWGNDGNIAPLVPALGSISNATFSYDFYPYSSNVYYVGFNAKRITESDSNMSFNFSSNKVRGFAWGVYPGTGANGFDAYRFWQSGMMTIAANPQGSYKVGDDYYYVRSAYTMVRTEASGWNRYWPQQPESQGKPGATALGATTLSGVGQLDAATYNDMWGNTGKGLKLKTPSAGPGVASHNNGSFDVTSEPTAATKIRVEKQGKVGRLVSYNGYITDTYDTKVDGTTSYFFLYGASNAAYDNMLITTYSESSLTMPVGSYADTFHCEVKMPSNITGSSINLAGGVKFKNVSTGALTTVSASDISIDGDAFRIKTPLAADTIYILTIGAGFGTESTVFQNDYTLRFKVRKLYEQDFNDSSIPVVGNIIRAYDTSDSNKIKIKNGRLWSFDGNIAPLVPELGSLSNATFSFDLYPYSGEYHYVGFNAARITRTDSNMQFLYCAHETRGFAWGVTPGSSPAGFAAYRMWQSCMTTIAANPQGSYQIGDDYYYERSNDTMTRTETGWNRYWPGGSGTALGATTLSGVGQLDAATYNEMYGNAGTPIRLKSKSSPGSASYGNGAFNVTSDVPATPVRVEKQDQVGKLVSYDGTIADTYDTKVGGNTSYFFLYNYHHDDGVNVCAYDNMLITTYEEINLSITSIDTANNRVVVQNNGSQTVNARVIVAAYDSNGRVISAVSPATSSFAAGTTNVSYSLSSAAGAVKYRALIWDNLESCCPIGQPTTYNP